MAMAYFSFGLIHFRQRGT